MEGPPRPGLLRAVKREGTSNTSKTPISSYPTQPRQLPLHQGLPTYPNRSMLQVKSIKRESRPGGGGQFSSLPVRPVKRPRSPEPSEVLTSIPDARGHHDKRVKTENGGRRVHQVDKNPKRKGIQVPRDIYITVLRNEAATRDQRKAAVDKVDKKEKEEARKCLLALFPNLPPGEDIVILGRAWERSSGRVGRTSKLSLEEKVRLAVVAHVRHMHTSYDARLREEFLKNGRRRVSSDVLRKVRSLTWKEVNDAVNNWRRGGTLVSMPQDIMRKRQERIREGAQSRGISGGLARQDYKGKGKAKPVETIGEKVVVVKNMEEIDLDLDEEDDGDGREEEEKFSKINISSSDREGNAEDWEGEDDFFYAEESEDEDYMDTSDGYMGEDSRTLRSTQLRSGSTEDECKGEDEDEDDDDGEDQDGDGDGEEEGNRDGGEEEEEGESEAAESDNESSEQAKGLKILGEQGTKGQVLEHEDKGEVGPEDLTEIVSSYKDKQPPVSKSGVDDKPKWNAPKKQDNIQVVIEARCMLGYDSIDEEEMGLYYEEE